MKLCVFPNDPLVSYYEKGEIKKRYFNPNNFFDEIHIISFIENDIEESKIQEIVGNAKLKIHPVGKINIKDRTKYVDKIVNLVKEIDPVVIRAYNPYLEGWFAAKCSEQLDIPLYLSLHTQYDENRKNVKKTNFKKFLGLKYLEKFIEPYVLKTAKKITVVFKIIFPYVIKHTGKEPELLYNKVDCERFENAKPISNLPSPLVLSVGNLIKEKNHQCVIEAMKNVDATLLIIGKGNQQDELMKLIKKNNLEEKVMMKESVPNKEIQNYYKSADVFTLAYTTNLEGLPIPVLEAMASGLPVVIPYPVREYSDGLEDTVIFADRSPESFSKKITRLLKDKEFHDQISKKSLVKAKEHDIRIIEKKEMEIYQELIKQKSMAN